MVTGKRPLPIERIFTLPRHYFISLLALTLGFSVYGCSDSATVNPVVELASLTVSPGTLQPAFSGETTQYQVDLANNVPSVTVSAQPAVAGGDAVCGGAEKVLPENIWDGISSVGHHSK